MRSDYGLPRVTRWSQITSDKGVQARLAQLYGNVDSIDAWVGVLAEDHPRGSSVGPLVAAVLRDQFTRLREGDRLWYARTFKGAELAALENTTLGQVIRNNTPIKDVSHAFMAPPGAAAG
jgi:hypothetical protein